MLKVSGFRQIMLDMYRINTFIQEKFKGFFMHLWCLILFIKQEGFKGFTPVLKKLQYESVLNYHKTKGDQDGKVEKDRKSSRTQ
jgi:hypothetical protein